jgi:hypothetical protein
MSSNIHLSITIDTECDKGAKWKVKQPLSYQNIYNGVVSRLQPVFDRYNVKATYLLSPEILIDKQSIEVFKSFKDRVELGTHLHTEFIEPEAHFTSETTSEFQSDFRPEIEKAKLENLTALFKSEFGYQPLSFRAGRFGISEQTLVFLEGLGYLVDSSVTPDMVHRNAKSQKLVNYFGAPYQPYYPSSKDYRKKGNMKILQVPVSLLNPRIAKLPLWLKRCITLDKPYQHILFNYATNFSKPIWLRPTYADLPTMKEVTNRLVKMNRGKDVFLCMMFHSNEFEVDMSPYSLTEAAMIKIIDRLDNYLDWLTKYHTTSSIGLSECKKVFDSANVKST